MMLIADSVGSCRLTKQDGGEAMRTKEIEGEALTTPTVGACFYMRAATLDPKVKEDADAVGYISGRLFNTSPLVEVIEQPEGFFTLVTKSGSKYTLEFL
jgi:hypothetical protein